MSDNWTPVTEVVKDALTFERNRIGEPRTIKPEAFDRWLAKVQAGAWDEGAAAWWNDRFEGVGEGITNPYREQ